jgi:hypothetical protein
MATTALSAASSFLVISSICKSKDLYNSSSFLVSILKLSIASDTFFSN